MTVINEDKKVASTILQLPLHGILCTYRIAASIKASVLYLRFVLVAKDVLFDRYHCVSSFGVDIRLNFTTPCTVLPNLIQFLTVWHSQYFSQRCICVSLECFEQPTNYDRFIRCLLSRLSIALFQEMERNN